MRQVSAPRLRGLYALTPQQPERGQASRLLDITERAIFGGARLIQYRDKTRDEMTARHRAALLCGLCHTSGALLIVNDRVDLARHVGADGVHLGEDDAPLDEARKTLRDDAVIGLSCYDSLQRAEDAEAAGADYVAFGSFFPSTTKPAARRADLELLARARERLQVPICCIGGITTDNGASLVAAGADLLAVVDGLFGRDDITGTARAFSRIFQQSPYRSAGSG